MNNFINNFAWADPTLFSWAQVAAAFTTAFATVALFIVTLVLAKYTRRLADEANKPFVICSIESSVASATAMQQVVRNTGNAPAFDVEISIDPPLKEADGEIANPTRTINMLPPGKELSLVGVMGKDIHESNFNIKVSWAGTPSGKKRESLEYQYQASDGFNAGWAAKGLHNLAEETQKTRELLGQVINGFKRVSVEMFDSEDREKEEADRELRRMKREQQRLEEDKT